MNETTGGSVRLTRWTNCSKSKWPGVAVSTCVRGSGPLQTRCLAAALAGHSPQSGDEPLLMVQRAAIPMAVNWSLFTRMWCLPNGR